MGTSAPAVDRESDVRIVSRRVFAICSGGVALEDLPMIEIPDSPGVRREVRAYMRGSLAVAAALIGAALALGVLAGLLTGCTPSARRAAMDVGFDTATCIVKHRNDTPEVIAVDCGIDIITNPSARELFATARAGADSDRLSACVGPLPLLPSRQSPPDDAGAAE